MTFLRSVNNELQTFVPILVIIVNFVTFALASSHKVQRKKDSLEILAIFSVRLSCFLVLDAILNCSLLILRHLLFCLIFDLAVWHQELAEYFLTALKIILRLSFSEIKFT